MLKGTKRASPKETITREYTGKERAWYKKPREEPRRSSKDKGE